MIGIAKDLFFPHFSEVFHKLIKIQTVYSVTVDVKESTMND